MVNKLPYPNAPSVLPMVTLTNLESCPGFLYLFGHLFAQYSSEPQVKQPSFPFSFFLPFLFKVVFWTEFFPLNLCKFFCTTLMLEEPSAPFTCESFALEFCSTLIWPMKSSTENSRLKCLRE